MSGGLGFRLGLVDDFLNLAQHLVGDAILLVARLDDAAPQPLEIDLVALLLGEHLDDDVDAGLDVAEADEALDVDARHVCVSLVGLDLADRAADPAGADAVVDAAFRLRGAHVGHHLHALRFAAQLDLELVAAQQPRRVGAQPVLAPQPPAEAVG